METEVLKELKLIRADLKYIKKQMVDQDMILAPVEKNFLEKSRRELRAGKARSLDEILKSRHVS